MSQHLVRTRISGHGGNSGREWGLTPVAWSSPLLHYFRLPITALEPTTSKRSAKVKVYLRRLNSAVLLIVCL
jgi:hypothetical protein